MKNIKKLCSKYKIIGIKLLEILKIVIKSIKLKLKYMLIA